MANASVRAVLDATALNGAKLSTVGMLPGATELLENDAIPFEDVEPVTGDYAVLDSSLPATAKEKDYFGFAFPVGAKAIVRLRFRVRTSCVESVGRRGYWYGGKSAGKPSASPY
jgi:hypothetical protein